MKTRARCVNGGCFEKAFSRQGAKRFSVHALQDMNDAMPDFGVTPPNGYRWLVESGVMGFKEWGPLSPWYLLASEDLFSPTDQWPDIPAAGKLMAFARRQDNDDVACFEINSGAVTAIALIHGWTPEGYDVRDSYKSIWEWLKAVIDDVAEGTNLNA
ncbi:MAG: hypothetical protein IT462_01495 [Planctomycetes bacterium]|nr:hypothetical protein [Planctomycetota bacterium]